MLPALRRGNVVGALAARPRTGRRRPRRARHAAGRRRRQARPARAARRRPDQRLPRRRPRPPGAGRVPRASSRSTRSCPTRRSRPISCWRPPAFGEQDGTTTNLEGRVQAVAQAVTRARHGAARLDDRRRAGVDARARHRLRHDRVGACQRRPPTERPASVRGRSPGGAAAEPPPNSYDYRLVVSRKLYDRAVGTAHVAVAGAARDRRRRPRPSARPRPRRRRRRHRRQAGRRRAARSCCRSSPTRRCSAARSGRRSTSPVAPTSTISSTPARR